MHDVRGPGRWLLRLLPRRAGERTFLPAYYDLHADYVAARRLKRSAFGRGLAGVSLAARATAAAIQCLILAMAERRPPSAVPAATPRRRGVDPMLTQDLRYGARMLWKNPGFTAVAVLALAIGVGANTAIFSVVHAVLLRPLPYRDAARIVELHETARGGLTTISPPNALDWRARSRTLARIGIYNDTTATLTGGAEPQRLDAALVDGDVFDVLGVPAMLGRTFTADDARPGAERVVVLGHGLWRSRFGGDPRIVGRPLTFDGTAFTVVGVMPAGFTFPGRIDLWFPLMLTADDLTPNQRGAHYVNAIARLQPGATVEQANDELGAIERSIAEQFEAVQGYGVFAAPILDSMVGGVRRPLLMLLGAVGFVLLIACVNVSNLLLARAATRRAEIAVRSALGAGRWRIVRQLLAESVLLSLAGGLAGVLLASWGVRALESVLPRDLPRAAGIQIDVPVLAFSLAVSVLTGLLFGLAPAVHASSADLAVSLKDARRDGAAVGPRRFLRGALVAVEVALALVLLAGAGLTIRSFDRLSRVPTGFDPSNVLLAGVTAPDSRYPDPAAVAGFYRDLTEGIASLPGVEAAGAVMIPPLARGGFAGTFNVIGRPDRDEEDSMQVRAATPGYFPALRIPLRRGRPFTAADSETGAPVALVSEEAARRFWPGQDPLGQRIRIHVGVNKNRERPREIVGVVGDVRTRTLDGSIPPVAYVPHAQYAADGMTIVVRSAGDAAAVLPMIRTRLRTLDREIALTNVRTGDQLVAASVAQPRFRMLLLGIFASVAVLLAAVGLYGVMAFSVSQRRAELGLRMALGAEPGDVLRLVLRQGLAPVGIGLAVGLGGAALLTRVMTGLLFQTDPLDPLTFGAVSLLLAAVAAVACYVPARRATTVDPLTALRYE
jgi:putative ABC transport system permease protein